MTCEQLSCTFDTSGGIFPNGYCIWMNIEGQWVAYECHCKEGYCCGESPVGIKRPSGQLLKVACTPKKKHEHKQQ